MHLYIQAAIQLRTSLSQRNKIEAGVCVVANSQFRARPHIRGLWITEDYGGLQRLIEDWVLVENGVRRCPG